MTTGSLAHHQMQSFLPWCALPGLYCSLHQLLQLLTVFPYLHLQSEETRHLIWTRRSGISAYLSVHSSLNSFFFLTHVVTLLNQTRKCIQNTLRSLAWENKHKCCMWLYKLKQKSCDSSCLENWKSLNCDLFLFIFFKKEMYSLLLLPYIIVRRLVGLVQ